MILRLIVAALCTWRLSSLLLYEGGPFDVFMCVRSLAARWSFSSQLFGCIKCLSLWVGLLCAVLMTTDYWIVMLPFALSVIAILVDQHV